MDRILVVEDESSTRGLLERFLKMKGYEVLTACDGEEGIAQIKGRPVDLVLTDLNMPRVGGLEVLAAARGVAARPEIIVMTGHASIRTAVLSMKLGACEIVEKPFQLDELDRTVRDVLERRRARAPKGPPETPSDPRTEFLSIVSHELRTPLTTIIGFSSLMVERVLGELTGDQNDALLRIGGKAEELLVVVNDMIQLASLNSQQAEVLASDCDLRRLVQDVILALAPKARGKKLDLRWQVPEGLGLRTDAAKLKAILSKLVANGIGFTASGSVTVMAEAVSGAGKVRICVKDTGIGIRPDQMPLLFRDFQQLEPSLTRTHGGLGIGLALCRKLCAVLGGEVEAESRPGEGSTFTVTLPAA